MMPGMDGPSTLARLRGNPQTSEIPVVFMTARAQTREVEHFITLGAQGVISKPFDPMTLASQVQDEHVRPGRAIPSLFEADGVGRNGDRRGLAD